MKENGEMPQNSNDTPTIHRVFGSFMRSQMEILDLTRIAIKALNSTPAMPALMEAVSEFDEQSIKGLNDRRLAEAKRDAEIAKKEISRGFPTLHRQATVLIFAQLEAYFEDLLANVLERNKTLLEQERVQKIKVSLSQFECMSSLERKYLIVDILQRDLQSSFKMGVSQFESVLEVFGLSGKVESETKKRLLELNNIRNVIVHRAGVADKRLVTTCPWLGLTSGDKVVVTFPQLHDYFLGTAKYGAEIYKRALRCCGGKASKANKVLAAIRQLELHGPKRVGVAG